MGAALLRNQFSRFSGVGNGEQFPDPFLDVASLAVPGTMRNALYWCLPPGQLVEMQDFGLKPVEAVRAGDLVRTKSGSVRAVEAHSVRRHVGTLTVLQYGGYGNTFPHRMTPDHKVWLFAGGKFDRVAAKDVKEGDVVATPLPKVTLHEPPRFSGWLFGLYLAEGCFIKNGWRRLGVRFTLGADDETGGVLSKLLGQVRDQTDLAVESFTPPSRPDVRLVTVHDPELPDWCHQHGGQRATEKQLTGKILGYGVDFATQLIAGWIDGDGWATANGLFGCTASKALALQIVRLSNACGMTPSIRQVENDKGFGSDGSVAWQVQFGKVDVDVLRDHCCKAAKVPAATSPARPKYWLAGDYALRPVVAVSVEEYDGPVHNFQVEGDHSYIADGVTTSNCEYIYSMCGTYRMAMERVISYFITDIDLKDVSQDEKEKWDDFLRQTLDAGSVIQNMLRDRMCYGNSFCSVVVPFKRFLVCPKCGSGYPLKVVADPANQSAFHFKWNLPDFLATCPNCKVGSGFSGKFKVDDKPDDEEKKIRVKRWNPHEIELLHDPYTDEAHYLWRIPEDYKQMVRKGNLFHLERAPKEVLNAIHKNQVFRFNPDTVYHMKEPTLAGILNRGWGIPRIISNFRQIWYVQVLHRFNEAIALDYVIPFRLITPGQKNGGGSGGAAAAQDPLLMFNGGDFRGQVQQMIRRRRRDPASWQILPFPVNYQMLGAEANQLAPRDLMDQGMETLLNDAGTPVELYKGSLQLQTAPVALRLFESTWHHLVHDSNALIQWLVEQIAQILSWEAVKAAFKRVTIADDIQKQMTALQLMMSQQLSGTSGLAALGYSWPQEQKQMAEEAREQAEIQARTQEEMEQAGFAQQIAKGQQPGAQPPGGDPSQGGGQPAPGGAGGGGGGGAQDPSAMGGAAGTPMQGPVTQYIQSMSPSVPQSPQDMLAAADSIAQQLLGLPESVKDSELRKLKQANPVLHSLVRTQMDSTRQQAKNQASQGGGGQPAG